MATTEFAWLPASLAFTRTFRSSTVLYKAYAPYGGPLLLRSPRCIDSAQLRAVVVPHLCLITGGLCASCDLLKYSNNEHAGTNSTVAQLTVARLNTFPSLSTDGRARRKNLRFYQYAAVWRSPERGAAQFSAWDTDGNKRGAPLGYDESPGDCCLCMRLANSPTGDWFGRQTKRYSSHLQLLRI